MEIQLFIHGVPDGWDFAGIPSEKTYFEKFYNTQNTLMNEFFVEIRQLDGQPYCYYHYIVRKDVISNTDRSGSYCGISLRSPLCYYSDTHSIYRLLDITFHSPSIIGVVLNPVNGKLKFAISTFSSTLINNLENKLGKILPFCINEKDFYKIDFKLKQETSTPQINLQDCVTTDLNIVLKQHGRFSLSNEYDSNTIKIVTKKHETTIKGIKEQYIEQINYKEKEIERLQTKTNKLLLNIDQLNSQILKERKYIAEVEDKNKEISYQLEKANYTEQSYRLLEQVKDPITELFTLLQKLSDKTHPQKEAISFKHWLSSLKHIILLVIVIVIILVVIAVVAYSLYNTKDGTNTKKHQTEFVSKQSMNE